MTKWIMAVLFFGGCVFGVTYLVVSPSDKPKDGEVREVVKKVQIVDKSDPAYTEVYAKSTCISCHGADLKGMPPAIPALLGSGAKHDKAGMMKIIKEGYKTMPAQYDANIKAGLTDEQLQSLAEWLAKQK